jgi:MerR family transcriptional regulator, copper efflux regulator
VQTQSVTIGKLARDGGVQAGTLRYYERLGLLAPASRTGAGYRVYRPETAQRLRFIRRAQGLGFSLEEIAELLALSDNPRASAKSVKNLTRRKAADIAQRIAQLERLKEALEEIEARCSGHGSSAECPILAALNSDEGSGERVGRTK